MRNLWNFKHVFISETIVMQINEIILTRSEIWLSKNTSLNIEIENGKEKLHFAMIPTYIHAICLQRLKGNTLYTRESNVWSLDS